MNDQWLVERALAFSAEHGVPVFPCRQDKSPTLPQVAQLGPGETEKLRKLKNRKAALDAGHNIHGLKKTGHQHNQKTQTN